MNQSQPSINRTCLAHQLVELFAPVSDLVAIYLFGSVAQAKAHRQSDIDVALLFDSTLDRQTIYTRTVTIGTLLETQLPTAVDVVALNLAPVALQFQILRTGLLVVDRDRTQRCLFQMRTMSRYYDAKPWLAYQQQQTLQRIRAKGLGYGYHGNRNALTEARRLRATLTPTAAGVTG